MERNSRGRPEPHGDRTNQTGLIQGQKRRLIGHLRTRQEKLKPPLGLQLAAAVHQPLNLQRYSAEEELRMTRGVSIVLHSSL